MIASILATLLGMATLVQLIYWLGIFSRLAFYKEKERVIAPTETHPPVSVIICARNEAQNLKNNLPHIINQNYRPLKLSS